MSEPPGAPSTKQLDLISQIVRGIARSRHMCVEDTEDFEQSVHMRLVERQYDVFRRFSGRSSLHTYLTVVVRRMLFDWQNQAYGKWRPSVRAQNLGRVGVELERLIHRDGFTRDEAIEITRHRFDCSHIELYHVVAQLPVRRPRRSVMVPVSDDSFGVMFVDPLALRERQCAEARVKASLVDALRRLSSRDRRLISLRYGHRQSVQEVAKRLQIDPKVLYRHFDRVLKILRRDMCKRENGTAGDCCVNIGLVGDSSMNDSRFLKTAHNC